VVADGVGASGDDVGTIGGIHPGALLQFDEYSGKELLRVKLRKGAGGLSLSAGRSDDVYDHRVLHEAGLYLADRLVGYSDATRPAGRSHRWGKSMTELRFDDRVAIVTGAGGGLGRAHARLLAQRGAKIVVNDIAVKDDAGRTPAERVVEEIVSAGGAAVAHSSSVSEPGAGAAAVETALDAFGRIDIVVNNAGIVRDRSFAKMSEDELAEVMGVHFHGSFALTKAAWEHFRKQSYGRVVLTTSVAGLFGNLGQANYSSAKAAMVGLGRTLAVEGERYGIKVNLVSPGAATSMTLAMLPADLHDTMSPDRVAPMVAYLSHETCAVSGEIFYAVAGRYARNFIAVTDGYTNREASVDDIAAHLDEIMDTSSWTIPSAAVELPR
jgi:NAD(P)-dependent dehydrogenase (short-subunit alcohol dehydrogenase family)